VTLPLQFEICFKFQLHGSGHKNVAMGKNEARCESEGIYIAFRFVNKFQLSSSINITAPNYFGLASSKDASS
jgi:hypothetical protein